MRKILSILFLIINIAGFAQVTPRPIQTFPHVTILDTTALVPVTQDSTHNPTGTKFKTYVATIADLQRKINLWQQNSFGYVQQDTTKYVGIGNTTPGANLDIYGGAIIHDNQNGYIFFNQNLGGHVVFAATAQQAQVVVTDSDLYFQGRSIPSTGDVLTYTSYGTADWQPSLNGWSTTGNAGTVVTNSSFSNFIGTTDDVDIVLARNNIASGYLNNARANTAFGVGSFNFGVNDGSYCTNIGYQSLGQAGNSSGSNNTTLGAYSMANFIGQFGGYSNTVIGAFSGDSMFDLAGSTNKNIIIGYKATVADGVSNSGIFGNNIYELQSNVLHLDDNYDTVRAASLTAGKGSVLVDATGHGDWIGQFPAASSINFSSVPFYANDAAADADSSLPSGGLYRITGNRTLFIKP